MSKMPGRVKSTLRFGVWLLALSLVACEAVPLDPEHTFQNVSESGMIRVIVIAGTPLAQTGPYLQALEVSTGANATVIEASAEVAFELLKAGKIDLVLGEFSAASPWATQVAFASAIAGEAHGEHFYFVRPAVRQGENRWLLTVTAAALAR